MYNPDAECKEMIEALKRICKQKGIKPHALARKAGISTSTISYILNGRTRPQVYTILVLCNALGIQIGDLFEGRWSSALQEIKKVSLDQQRGVIGDEDKLLDDYRCLSDKKRQLLWIYIDMLKNYDEKYLYN